MMKRMDKMKNLDKLFSLVQGVAGANDVAGEYEAYRKEYCALIGILERVIEEVHMDFPAARVAIDRKIVAEVKSYEERLKKRRENQSTEAEI